MAKSPLFRADHVGSLLRPPELRQAFKEMRSGDISRAEFRKVQDQAVRDVIQLQEEVGLQSITDGEFRRISYWAKFVETVEGLTTAKSLYKFRDEEGNEADFLSPHVASAVKRTRPIAADEFEFLRDHTQQTPKMTLPSPPTMHFWRGPQGVDKKAYPDLDAYFHDLAKVYQQEIADLAARGCTYIQIDDVPLAMLSAAEVRDAVREMGDDPEALIGRYVDLTNAAVSSRPANMTVAMHLCRGNFKGRWLSEGGYEHVGERLFNEIDVDTFFLEYDTERAGDFRPLRFVPDNKSVVLGLVSSKTGVLEAPDQLKRRIDEATKYISHNQLGLSPQCGFASTVGGNDLTIADQKRKLSLVVKVADSVWGSGN